MSENTIDLNDLSPTALKVLKRDATRSFNHRKTSKKQLVIAVASNNCERKKVLYTNSPFRKLTVINPLLEKQQQKYDRRIATRRVFEHSAQI